MAGTTDNAPKARTGKWYSAEQAIEYLKGKCTGNVKIARSWLQYQQSGLIKGTHYRYVEGGTIERFNRRNLQFSRAGLDLIVEVHNFRQRIKESKK